MKHQRQLEEARATSAAAIKELEQLQNEKRKMLMEHETQKLRELDDAYGQELREWKAQLKPRKQVNYLYDYLFTKSRNLIFLVWIWFRHLKWFKSWAEILENPGFESLLRKVKKCLFFFSFHLQILHKNWVSLILIIFWYLTLLFINQIKHVCFYWYLIC